MNKPFVPFDPFSELDWPLWWGVTEGRAPAVVLMDYGNSLITDGYTWMRDQEVYSYVVTPQE